MEVEKPNLFYFATSELSQDAFICWLASWAKPQLKEVDDLLHKTAQDFINSLILKCKTKDEVPEIQTINIKRQDDRIDILILINKGNENQLAILIEDKTQTDHHSGQLERYYKIVNEKFSEDQIIPIFFKTGYQSHFNIGEKYKTYLRKDFLDILQKGKSNGVENEIYIDFLANLERIENAVVQYKIKPLNEKWIATDWIGFYMDLFNELGKSNSSNWNYIANPSGGFYGFWWGFIDTGKGFTAYLQLEQEKLCLKIEVPSDENRISARVKACNLLTEAAKNSDFNFIRPQRMGNGKYMTVLLLADDYRIPQDGVLDMGKTIILLKAIHQMLLKTFLPEWLSNQAII